MASDKAKYRPYFSDADLDSIISALKERNTGRDITIVRYLENFRLRISRGLIDPSITLTPKPTLEEKLGLTEYKDISITPEEIYEKWKSDPSSCNINELRTVMKYRYTNNLMSPEEESEYEL